MSSQEEVDLVCGLDKLRGGGEGGTVPEKEYSRKSVIVGSIHVMFHIVDDRLTDGLTARKLGLYNSDIHLFICSSIL